MQKLFQDYSNCNKHNGWDKNAIQKSKSWEKWTERHTP